MKKSLEIPGDLHEQFFRCHSVHVISKHNALFADTSRARLMDSKQCRIFSEGVFSLINEINPVSK
jgi:hypothetical protein